MTDHIKDPPLDQLLTPRQAADLLSLKLSTIYAWSYKRRIPSIRIGSRLRFERSAILKLIADGRRPAMRPHDGDRRREGER